MNVSVYAHIEHNTEAAVDMRNYNASDCVILRAGGITLLIHSRDKALELAGLLESAAQKWEVSHEHGES